MKNKKRIYTILVTSIIILIVTSMMFYIFNNLDRKFKAAYHNNVITLQRELTTVNTILELEGKYANEVINRDTIIEDLRSSKYAIILDYFVYDEELDLFHLDKLEETNLDLSKINNITGKGDLGFLADIDSLKLREIYFSILMNDSFYLMNEKITASSWVYYVSKNEMLSLRSVSNEYVTSEKVHYLDRVLEYPYITSGSKDELEDRTTVLWTEPYVDLGGSGLMVTASYVVDYGDEYLGTICVDFMSNYLNDQLIDDYITYLLDENGNIVASNVKVDNFNNEVINIEDLDTFISFSEAEGLERDVIHTVNNRKIIVHDIEGTPYTMYQVYPRGEYLNDVALDARPVLIFLVMFILMSITYLKVRESEEKLKITLDTLENKQLELDYIAKFDQLTDVYNRRGLHERVDELKTQGAMKESTIIILDIDYFKQINDTYGHDVGDKVLRELCNVIKDSIKEEYILARYGGEEFVVVLPKTDLLEGNVIAEKVRRAVEIYDGFDSIDSLTISLGVAECSNDDDNESWFKKADDALYRAKKFSRNVVCYHENDEIKPYLKTNKVVQAANMSIDAMDYLTIWNEKRELIYVSKEFVELLKTDKEQYKSNYDRFAPEIQYSGKSSKEVIEDLLNKHYNIENFPIKYQLIDSDNNIIEGLVKYKVIKIDKETYIIAARKIMDRKKDKEEGSEEDR